MTILEAFPLDENGQASRSAITVLLSDGQNQSGIDPIVMAKRAARLGVRVYTVGVGKLTSGGLDFDETALRSIALATGGQYYAVGSASRLREVYGQIGNSLGWGAPPHRSHRDGDAGGRAPAGPEPVPDAAFAAGDLSGKVKS